MIEPALTTMLLLSGLAAGATSAGAWVWRGRGALRRREDACLQALRRLMPRASLRVGRAWRAQAQREDDERWAVELVPGASAAWLTMHVGRYLGPQRSPEGLSLELTRQRVGEQGELAPQRSLDARSHGVLTLRLPSPEGAPGALGEDPSLTLEGCAQELLGGLWPALLDALAELEPFHTEPVVALSVSQGWLIVTRQIDQRALAVRGLRSVPDMTRYLEQLARQSWRVCAQAQPISPSPLDALVHLFHAAAPFGAVRQQALRALMTRGWGSPHAALVWQHVLTQGNLYDALLLLNLHQQRFLQDISPERLVALVNGIQQSGRFETSALPQLLARRFDFRVVLHEGLDESVCLALVRLGMAELPHQRTQEILHGLYARLSPARRVEVLALAAQTDYMPMLAILSKSDAQGPSALVERMALVMEHLLALGGESQTPEHALEPLALALLEAPQQTDQGRHAALVVLGRVGLWRAHATLQRKSQGFGLERRRVKRALEAIEARMHASPQRGHLSLSDHQDSALGALSVTSPPSGRLELIDEER